MLIDMKSNLTWQGTTKKAPGKYDIGDIQNRVTSFQENDLKVQYNKFHIYDAENINRHSLGRLTDQPFIIRGIQRRDGDVQRYKLGDVGTFVSRLAEDSARFAKLLISPKGLVWSLKQFGLHASNPNVETNIGIRPTKVFDPLSLMANIPGAPVGIHSARHGTIGIRGKYGDVQRTILIADQEGVQGNRLEKLRKELIGQESAGSVDQGSPTSLWGSVVQGVSNFVAPLQNLLAGFDGSEIKTLSGPGGPDSVYGIGYTTIRRSTTTGASLKDNLGNSYWSIHYNSGAPYEADNGSARTLLSKTAPGNSVFKTFDNSMHNGDNETLPNFDAETGGYGRLIVSNKFNASGYIESNSPKGGRFVGSDVTTESDLDRAKVDITSGRIDDSGKTIIQDLAPTPASYLESNSPAQNKNKDDDSPGGGRYVGTSYDAKEETHERLKNAAGEDILEAAHKYHIYQNREDDYPEGYYSLMNANSGPRGKPTGPSVHNIFRTIEEEQEQVRSSINGKRIHEHVHSFLYGPAGKSVDTKIIDKIKLGYNANWLHAFQQDGQDWDVTDRINLHVHLDQTNDDISNTNTPQIRTSADRVFQPGFSLDPKGQHVITSPSQTSTSTLGGMLTGDKIFNYFTPDLKYFKSITRIQLDEGDTGHDYNSIASRFRDREDLDILTYNDIDYTPAYTILDPKLGPSAPAGQQPISGQKSNALTEVDNLIKTKLDPLENGVLPNSTGVRAIGGAPSADAGTPVVYSYMDYTKLRNQESSVTNPKRINEFRQNVNSAVAAEIKSRNRDKLGYGGAGQPDSLNITNPGQAPGQEDMVPFYISELGGASSLYFRAGINSISDTFSPSWTQIKEIGRADPKILLEGWGRAFSLDLTLAAGSSGELKPMWEKLNTLASWTAPDYSKGNGYTGTFIELTLGDLYQQVPCYLSGFSVDIDNETPWEITAGRRVPKYASVSLDLTYIGSEMPQKGQQFFAMAAGTPGSVVSNSGEGAAANAALGDIGSVGDAYDMAKDIGGAALDGATAGAKKIFSALNPFD